MSPKAQVVETLFKNCLSILQVVNSDEAQVAMASLVSVMIKEASNGSPETEKGLYGSAMGAFGKYPEIVTDLKLYQEPQPKPIAPLSADHHVFGMGLGCA